MATTADDVWGLLAELVEVQKETERILKEQSLETERRFQETERLLKQESLETERILKEQSLETERRFRETDRQIKQVNQQIGKLGNRLGEFVEWQVRPSSGEIYDTVGELILLNVGRDVACNVSTDRIRISRINQQNHLFQGKPFFKKTGDRRLMVTASE